MEEFWKSVNLWQSYGQQQGVMFFWLTWLFDHHAKFGCCFSCCVRACRMSQNFLGCWDPARLDMWRGWPPRSTLLHTCATIVTEFGRCMSNRMGVDMGSQKFRDAGTPLLKVRVWPLETRSSHKCYHRKFDRFGSNGWCVITVILWKVWFDPSRPTFQGHSMSLEPTRIDRPPVTS